MFGGPASSTSFAYCSISSADEVVSASSSFISARGVCSPCVALDLKVTGGHVRRVSNAECGKGPDRSTDERLVVCGRTSALVSFDVAHQAQQESVPAMVSTRGLEEGEEGWEIEAWRSSLYGRRAMNGRARALLIASRSRQGVTAISVAAGGIGFGVREKEAFKRCG